MNKIRDNDTQTLLDLLDSEEVSSEVRRTITQEENTVLAFIYHYNIRAGEIEVRDVLLYKLFKLYTKFNISKTEFTRMMRNIFPHRDQINYVYYKINIDPMDICHILLDAKKDSSTVRNIKYIRHFEMFLKVTKLKPGNYWVDSKSLYDVYKKALPRKKNRPWLTYRKFISLLELHFVKKRITISYAKYFKVNNNYKFYISQEVIDERRKHNADAERHRERNRLSMQKTRRRQKEAQSQNQNLQEGSSGVQSPTPGSEPEEQN